MKTSIAIGALALAGLADTACATVTLHTSEAGFKSNLSSFAIDTFDDLPAFSPVGTTLNRNAGSFTYAVNAPSGLFTAGSGADTDVWLSSADLNDTMVFTPSGALPTAIGGWFFTTDFIGSETPGDVQITVVDGAGSQTFTLTNTNSSTFFGFTSDSGLVQLQLRSLGGAGSIWPTANDLIIGQLVPAPGAAAMLGIGAVLARRRRR